MKYEKFEKIMNHILNQMNMDDEINKIFRKYKNESTMMNGGWLMEDCIELLEYRMGDTDNTISWWMFDVTDKEKHAFIKTKEKEYHIVTIQNLYDYLIENYEQKPDTDK